MRLHQILMRGSLLLALAASGCRGFAPTGRPSTPKTATATLTDAQEEQQPAWSQVKGALDLWTKEIGIAAVQQLSKAQQMAGNDSAFFLHAGDMLARANAWPLAAVMYLNLKRIQPNNLPADQLIKIHEAAYRSGEDPQSVRVFMVYNDPWLDLGRVRAQLRSGDVSGAAGNIKEVMADASLLAEFPEALLVDTEVLIAQKEWNQANADLDRLAGFPNLPAWITTEAGRLRGLAQPN